MDPLSALSFFCNILDLTDKAITVITVFRELYHSSEGRRGKDTAILNFASDIEEVLNSFSAHHKDTLRNPGAADGMMSTVLRESKRVVSEITHLVDECKVRNPGHKLSVLRALGFSLVNNRKLENRLGEMKKCRDDLNLLMVKSTQ